MALDAHLVVSPDRDPTTWPAWSIEDLPHAQLFAGSPLDESKYPYLARMADYYADAVFGPEELESLQCEISGFAATVEFAVDCWTFAAGQPRLEVLANFLVGNRSETESLVRRAARRLGQSEFAFHYIRSHYRGNAFIKSDSS